MSWRGLGGEKLILALVLLGGLGLRLQHIDNPFLDWHAWRQADTAAMARLFWEQENNILRPQLYYYGGPPNYAELELGVLPYLTAQLYALFGEGERMSRLVVVAFSLWSVASIYRLGAALWDRRTGLWAAAVAAWLPFYVYFGRSFQPDVPMIALALAALVRFRRYLDEGDGKDKTRAWLLAALALMTKPPAAFLLVPMGYWLWTERRLTWRRAAYIGTLPLPLALYWSEIHRVASHPFMSGIFATARQGFFGELGSAEFYRVLGEGALYFLATPFLVLPLLVGLFRLGRQKGLWLMWGLALFTFFVLAGTAILTHLPYYLLPAVPWASLLAARGLAMEGRKAGLVLAGALLLTSYHDKAIAPLFPDGIAHRWWYNRDWYAVTWDKWEAAREVQAVLPEGELLAVVDDSPEILYYSRRFGWFGPAEEIRKMLPRIEGEGGRYLLAMGRGEPWGEPLRSGPNWTIYRLPPPSSTGNTPP